MAHRRLAFAMLVLLASTPSAAQQVYQWKDANGVTQYSNTPPADAEFQSREIRVRDGVPAPLPAKPVEDPACTVARGNLDLLDGEGSLRVDEDHDGKPDRTITDAERDAQRELAEATIKLRCTTASAIAKQ